MWLPQSPLQLNPVEAMELLLDKLDFTKSNREFLGTLTMRWMG